MIPDRQHISTTHLLRMFDGVSQCTISVVVIVASVLRPFQPPGNFLAIPAHALPSPNAHSSADPACSGRGRTAREKEHRDFIGQGPQVPAKCQGTSTLLAEWLGASAYGSLFENTNNLRVPQTGSRMRRCGVWGLSRRRAFSARRLELAENEVCSFLMFLDPISQGPAFRGTRWTANDMPSARDLCCVSCRQVYQMLVLLPWRAPPISCTR